MILYTAIFNMRYLILFLLAPLGVFSQLDSIPPPPIDSIPPCVITNLQGEISCFPWSPNQGELNVNWEAPPGCNPVGFYRGCLLYTSPSPRDQRGSRKAA